MPSSQRERYPKPLDLLRWRDGRRAVDQTALLNEHCHCTVCHDNREIVLRYESGDAVWGPCQGCNADGRASAPSFAEWAVAP